MLLLPPRKIETSKLSNAFPLSKKKAVAGAEAEANTQHASTAALFHTGRRLFLTDFGMAGPSLGKCTETFFANNGDDADD